MAALAGIAVVAAALLVPVVVGPLVRLATRPVRRASGAGGMMIRAEPLNATRRTASTAGYPTGETTKLRGYSVVVPEGAPGLSEVIARGFGLPGRETRAAAGNDAALAVGYTGIAVANAMAMAAQSRRADFTVLRSAGATLRQVLRLVAGETALVVALGTVLGLLVTLPPLAAMAAGLTEATSTPVALSLDWPGVALVIGSCLVLAVGASVLMSWRSQRTSVLT
ncbi:MAG: putative transport system permease protein [Actinomycetota bacterium]|nr:putative transport system permease protein [Actinomycetota bacterium]